MKGKEAGFLASGGLELFGLTAVTFLIPILCKKPPVALGFEPPWQANPSSR